MCRLYEWLYALIPFRPIRARLLKSHIESCPRCREKFEPAAGLEDVAAPPAWIESEESLWPAVRDRLRLSPPAKKNPRTRPDRLGLGLRWTIPAAFAGILLAGLAGFLLFRPSFDSNDLPRVSIVRAESGGRKAETYFYQTQQASYVWISTSPKKNGE